MNYSQNYHNYYRHQRTEPLLEGALTNAAAARAWRYLYIACRHKIRALSGQHPETNCICPTDPRF